MIRLELGDVLQDDLVQEDGHGVEVAGEGVGADAQGFERGAAAIRCWGECYFLRALDRGRKVASRDRAAQVPDETTQANPASPFLPTDLTVIGRFSVQPSLPISGNRRATGADPAARPFSVHEHLLCP